MTEMDDLTFATLRRTNVARCESAFHPLDSWSLTDWATAVGGECGEALNIVKKLRRLDVETSPVNVPDRESLLDALASEIADTVIYADLLAARAGIDLAAAVRAKFNAVSRRVGSEVQL